MRVSLSFPPSGRDWSQELILAHVEDDSYHHIKLNRSDSPWGVLRVFFLLTHAGQSQPCLLCLRCGALCCAAFRLPTQLRCIEGRFSSFAVLVQSASQSIIGSRVAQVIVSWLLASIMSADRTVIRNGQKFHEAPLASQQAAGNTLCFK